MIDLKGKVTVVMGGQYGSEGKGEVVAWLAAEKQVGAVIRTGGPNAGHTMTVDAIPYKMRQVPCGWHVGWESVDGVETLQSVDLMIGRGSLIDCEVLDRELDMVLATGRKPVVIVDPQATIMDHKYAQEEVEAKLYERLGSTQEGIGAARAARMWRLAETAGGQCAQKSGAFYKLSCKWPDVLAVADINGDKVWPLLQYHLRHDGQGVVIESTQGFGLSLHASGHYPYCTSADITPGHIMGDAGFSSRVPHQVLAVVRTFPIRVAGNSGPMGGREVTWAEMQRHSDTVPIDGEKTTVTGRTRRISEISMEQIRQMARNCRPDGVVLTFMDYVYDDLRNATEWRQVADRDMRGYIESVETAANCPVVAVSVGPGKVIERD